MSTEERVTQVPDGLEGGVKKKEKDPKKVAAGKALAEKNKRAREALRREEESKAENKELKEEKELGDSYFSFSNILTVIGIGFTIVSFYREYKNLSKHDQTSLCHATECKTGSRKVRDLSPASETKTKPNQKSMNLY